MWFQFKEVFSSSWYLVRLHYFIVADNYLAASLFDLSSDSYKDNVIPKTYDLIF